jgi:hypothetical protein
MQHEYEDEREHEHVHGHEHGLGHRHTVGATELVRSLSNAILDKLHKEFQPDFFC